MLLKYAADPVCAITVTENKQIEQKLWIGSAQSYLISLSCWLKDRTGQQTNTLDFID